MALSKAEIVAHLKAGDKLYGNVWHGWRCIACGGYTFECNSRSMRALIKAGAVVVDKTEPMKWKLSTEA